jgi:hypothetical protein
MAYIGKTPVIGNFQVCDAITVVDAQAAYTMQVAGVNVSPESANHMIVSLNGVIQKPTDAFTVSGSTITFASNLVTGDVIDFIQILGNVLDLGVPSDATVTTAKIVDANVTSAKMFSGFKNGITEADQWRLTADITADVNPISANLERIDDVGFGYIGTGMSVSSGTWTFPSTGLYLVKYNCGMSTNTTNNTVFLTLHTTNDNSTYDIASQQGASAVATNQSNIIVDEIFFNVTNISTHKVRFQVSSIGGTGSRVRGDTAFNETAFTFIRLGDSV